MYYVFEYVATNSSIDNDASLCAYTYKYQKHIWIIFTLHRIVS